MNTSGTLCHPRMCHRTSQLSHSLYLFVSLVLAGHCEGVTPPDWLLAMAGTLATVVSQDTPAQAAIKGLGRTLRDEQCRTKWSYSELIVSICSSDAVLKEFSVSSFTDKLLKEFPALSAARLSKTIWHTIPFYTLLMLWSAYVESDDV